LSTVWWKKTGIFSFFMSEQEKVFVCFITLKALGMSEKVKCSETIRTEVSEGLEKTRK